MTRLIYYLEPSALKAYLASKDDLSAAKNGMTAEGIKLAISEIYKAARVHRAPVQAGIIIGFPESPPSQPDAPLYTMDADGVAHIPIEGLLVPKANPCAAFFAEAETEYGFITAAAKAADADPLVREIAFDINSPGGYADGLDETAIALAGLTKPTRSDVHDLAASAAYWLASQTDKILAASPAALFGSIGVAMEIIDSSGADAQHGYKRITLTSTDAPLKRPDLTTDEGQAVLIKELDDLHGVFVSRVAEGRGVSVSTVNKDFGRGGVLIAADARKVGMIDEIAGQSIARKRTAGVAGATVAKADGTLKTGGAKNMTLDELKRDHPDLYAAVYSAGEASGEVKGVTKGVAQERARVQALQKWADADAENAKVVGIVKEAQATGKSEADVMPQLQVAMRNAAPAGDNPPAVSTATPANGGNAVGVDPEAIRMGAKMGVTAADIAKFSGEQKEGR